jgi:hypothetical protein
MLQGDEQIAALASLQISEAALGQYRWGRGLDGFDLVVPKFWLPGETSEAVRWRGALRGAVGVLTVGRSLVGLRYG